MTTTAEKRKEFGAFLAELRELRNCSVHDVARATKISNPYLYQVESGKKALTNPEYFQLLANFFEVSVLDLLKKAGYIVEVENHTQRMVDFIIKDKAYDLKFLASSKITPEEKRSVIKLYEKARGKKLL